MLNPVANLLNPIERERVVASIRERERGVILPVRSYNQRSAGTILVTRVRPIRERLG